jgi:hypothetical protein
MSNWIVIVGEGTHKCGGIITHTELKRKDSSEKLAMCAWLGKILPPSDKRRNVTILSACEMGAIS